MPGQAAAAVVRSIGEERAGSQRVSMLTVGPSIDSSWSRTMRSCSSHQGLAGEDLGLVAVPSRDDPGSASVLGGGDGRPDKAVFTDESHPPALVVEGPAVWLEGVARPLSSDLGELARALLGRVGCI